MRARLTVVLRRFRNAAVVRYRYWKYLFTARSESEKAIQKRQGHNVLVLCYGNIFRSPFVARRLAERLSPGNWEVRSAGFYANSGRSCAAEFIGLARSYDVDLTPHRSAVVSREDIEWADIIVIMDGRNRLLLEQFGDATNDKVVWIAAWLSGLRADVEDPYGITFDEVRRITARLAAATESLVIQLAPSHKQ